MLNEQQQTQLLVDHARQVLVPTNPTTNSDWQAFEQRLTQYLPALVNELSTVYGEREDFLSFLDSLLHSAYQTWQARPTALKAQDAEHEHHPDWFTSEKMVGGVCYVDLFAGNLPGIIQKIPYFQELGLTYLH
ncbi:MAG TPA: amylosucrase, partial [Thiolinea sp.]|nr:amylosucrase [Thiolinea sp.]